MPFQQLLFALQDTDYKAFQCKLIPSVPPDSVIGVRMPALRRLARQLYQQDNYGPFLLSLPHRYYDENNLHGALICEMTDYHLCIKALNSFLPYVDNWATCDLLRPKAFRIMVRKQPQALLSDIRRWLCSDHPYTIRFGMEMLMTFFLDSPNTQADTRQAHFRPEYLDWVADDTHEHYYVRMMVAWFFATALAKQYDATLPYLETHRLHPWTHRKAIQKAIESYRIPSHRKAYLLTLLDTHGS